MPIYEYECHACQHKLDTLQKIDEAPLVVCPACGESSLQKMISSTSFQLKGTGWYATDFKNKGAAPTKETKTDTSSGSSSSTTDSKNSSS